MNEFLTTFKIPPFPDYLKPHMSQEDYSFMYYWEWLEDEYFSESDDNCEPPSDLLEPAKFQKYCDLKHLKATVWCKFVLGNYATRPMEVYLKPHMSEEDYRFFRYMEWLDETYALKRVLDVTTLLPVDLTDPIKAKKYETLGVLINKATAEYIFSLPLSTI